MIIPIWSPRYCDKKVLVDKLKVKEGRNYMYFCCDKNYPYLYSFDGTRVKRECSLCFNGKIYCYQIPLEWLFAEGELPKDLEEKRQQEHSKYQKFLERKKNK